MNTVSVDRSRITLILQDINNLYAATIESENRRSVLNRIERIHNELAALTQPEQPEARRDACSRCHGVDGDCDALMSDDPTACPCRCHEPQVQDESHRICGCEECRGPTPYEAEHPSEGNVGRYYGEAVGANTWDIYRPDGSFLAHIDRPGVFYAILDELNKLNATTRQQAQEARRDELLPCAWCGSPAVSIGMAGVPEPYADREMFTCSNEECPVGEASLSRNQWNRRDHPPTNAEAVRLLRKVWHCRTGYGTAVCEMLAEDDYDDLCAEVETFLAQHGGRGDE